MAFLPVKLMEEFCTLTEEFCTPIVAAAIRWRGVRPCHNPAVGFATRRAPGLFPVRRAARADIFAVVKLRAAVMAKKLRTRVSSAGHQAACGHLTRF